MGGVEVTADDDVMFFCFQGVCIAEELVVEIEFVLESFLVFLSVWEVDIEQGKGGIGDNQDASFAVELLSSKPGFNAQWFLFGECCHAAVAFSFGGVPEEMVVGDVFEMRRELLWCCLYLLETHDVWCFFQKPGEETFFIYRSDAVDVPAEYLHLRIPPVFFLVVGGISFSLYMVLNVMLGDALEQCDIKSVGIVCIRPSSLFFQEVKVIMSREESLDLCFPF